MRRHFGVQRADMTPTLPWVVDPSGSEGFQQIWLVISPHSTVVLEYKAEPEECRVYGKKLLPDFFREGRTLSS